MKKILIIIAIIFGITGFTHVKAATEKTIINNLVSEDKNKSTENIINAKSENKSSEAASKDWWCFEQSRTIVTQLSADGDLYTTTFINYTCSWMPGFNGVTFNYYFF